MNFIIQEVNLTYIAEVSNTKQYSFEKLYGFCFIYLMTGHIIYNNGAISQWNKINFKDNN